MSLCKVSSLSNFTLCVEPFFLFLRQATGKVPANLKRSYVDVSSCFSSVYYTLFHMNIIG